MLRGRKLGLEIVLAERDLDEALEELGARLVERPDFYRGTSAIANFGATLPSSDFLNALGALLAEAGIELRAVAGSSELQEAAAAAGLAFEAATVDGAELERRRALRPRGEIKLSPSARSLVADFAGARADIADRRRRGEASVPKLIEDVPKPADSAPPPAPALHVVEAPPETLYHSGTVRGGQALHHLGNIVVVGDVNPGAELIATGDVVVFGRLAGVAHAGAQGDANARVYALDLDPTQLRIATFIAADSRVAARASTEPEIALVRDGCIVVVPFDRLGQLERGAS